VNLEGVTRAELGNIVTQRGCIYAIEDMH